MSRSSSRAVTLRLSPRGFNIQAGVDVEAVQQESLQPWPAQCRSGDAKLVAAALDDLSPKVVRGKSQLDVIVDNAWTRFQLVRFPAGVRTSEECKAFLKANFRSVFGSEADAWHIIAEPTYFGLPVLAVAIDTIMLTALSKFAGRLKLILRSVQPQFVDAFNGLRHTLPAHQGAFAQIDGERICMALWRQRAWVAVRSQPMASRDPAAVTAMLSQMLVHIDPPLEYGSLHLLGGPSGQTQAWESHLPAGWTANCLPMRSS